MVYKRFVFDSRNSAFEKIKEEVIKEGYTDAFILKEREIVEKKLFGLIKRKKWIFDVAFSEKNVERRRLK